MKPSIPLAITVATVVTLASSSAAVISVNFRQSNANQQLAADTVAGGGLGIPASNWNDAVGTTSPDEGAASIPLVSNTGAPSGAAISWVAAGTWGDGSAEGAANEGIGNARLQRGYLDDGGAGPLITVTGIPYDLYNVVVYFSTDTTGGLYRPVEVTGSNSGLQTINTTGTKLLWSENPQFDATNQAVAFNVTGSSVVIDAMSRDGDNRGSISGIQIVLIPEPSTITLFGLAGFALITRRKR